MVENKDYQVVLTKQASKLLKNIKDRREQEILLARLEQLKKEPEKQGKALVNELVGYRSIRAVGQRFRIIYQIKEEKVLVLVVAVGRRKQGDKKDIYTITKKIIGNLETQDGD